MMIGRNNYTQESALNTVLNLNRLTKRGKINWSVPVEENIVYLAELEGYRIEIRRDAPPSRAVARVLGTHSQQSPYWISVRGPDGDENVVRPMSAINDLVETIKRKRGEAVESVGDQNTLDRFNRLLEEEA